VREPCPLLQVSECRPQLRRLRLLKLDHATKRQILNRAAGCKTRSGQQWQHHRWMRHCKTGARCNDSVDARATGKEQRATIKTRRSATTHRRCCMEFCFMIRATNESSLSAGAMSASSSIGVSPSASASSAMIIARRDAIDSSSHLLALNVSRRTCASDQFEKHRNWHAMMHQSDNRVFVRFANPPESFIFRCNLAESCENPENNAGATHVVRGTLETMSLMMAGPLSTMLSLR
jgi:hypothetical protein